MCSIAKIGRSCSLLLPLYLFLFLSSSVHLDKLCVVVYREGKSSMERHVVVCTHYTFGIALITAAFCLPSTAAHVSRRIESH